MDPLNLVKAKETAKIASSSGNLLVYTDVTAAVIKYLLLAITDLLCRLWDQRLSFSQACHSLRVLYLFVWKTVLEIYLEIYQARPLLGNYPLFQLLACQP